MAPVPIDLTPEQILQFQRDGAICLRQIYSEEWLHKISVGIEKNLALQSPHVEIITIENEDARYIGDYCNWRNVPEYQDFVYHSPTAQITAQLMQTQQTIFYHEHLLIKEPGASKTTPWHADQAYYPVNGEQNCSVWMPLDPVKKENGVHFIAGSHALGCWFTPRKFKTSSNYIKSKQVENDHFYTDVPNIDAEPEKYKILSWDIEPGDAIFFHMKTLHGAYGNKNRETSRRILSTRWLGDDASFALRPWEISPPITGDLKVGESMACSEFPVVWTKENGYLY